LEYTEEQAKLVKKNWEKKIAKKQEDEKENRAKALSKAKDVASFLQHNYKVEKVYLYGSLAWRNRFTSHSDIDLYIYNFPPDQSYWEALAKAEEIAIPFPLTLVLDENANPKLREKIEQEGIKL
jgi:uncharacterized protein